MEKQLAAIVTPVARETGPPVYIPDKIEELICALHPTDSMRMQRRKDYIAYITYLIVNNPAKVAAFWSDEEKRLQKELAEFASEKRLRPVFKLMKTGLTIFVSWLGSRW